MCRYQGGSFAAPADVPAERVKAAITQITIAMAGRLLLRIMAQHPWATGSETQFGHACRRLSNPHASEDAFRQPQLELPR